VDSLRVLVCGSRNWTDRKAIEDFIKTLPKDTVIIEGECRGADRISREIAKVYGLEVLKFPAKWNQYRKAAGPIRNKEMLDKGKPDQVFAFHDNISGSKGTKNMIDQACKRGIPVTIITSGGEHETT